MPSHEQSVQQQFDPQAQAYLTSAVHAQGPDLVEALRLTRPAMPASARALDVGCGAGHLSFALAPAVERMVALDPSPGMLATVARAAAQRGLPNIETCEGSASQLPYPAGTFDLVCSRYSAHHWLDVPAALREMRRVLRPAGVLLLIDIAGHASPLADTHLQAMELLRDPSHVRDYSIREWTALLQESGFGHIEHQSWPTRLEFGPWVQRMRTSQARIAAIRELQGGAPEEVRQALGLETDGSFTTETVLFSAG